jgi:hypothetical protein
MFPDHARARQRRHVGHRSTLGVPPGRLDDDSALPRHRVLEDLAWFDRPRIRNGTGVRM